MGLVYNALVMWRVEFTPFTIRYLHGQQGHVDLKGVQLHTNNGQRFQIISCSKVNYKCYENIFMLLLFSLTFQDWPFMLISFCLGVFWRPFDVSWATLTRPFYTFARPRPVRVLFVCPAPNNILTNIVGNTYPFFSVFLFPTPVWPNFSATAEPFVFLEQFNLVISARGSRTAIDKMQRQINK